MSTYPSDEIGQLPGIANFGSGFSYAAWTPGTTVTLCNVPWNNDYRDIVKYDSKADLNTYLDNNAGPKLSIDKLTYCRVGMPIRLNVPFGQAYTYNYLRVVNAPQPVSGHGDGYNISEATAQTLYYFITDVRYLAPNTTEIWVQLDVWQTFCHEITFGNCYIERGHIGIANESQFDDNGRTYLTVPEGLDVGNEYVINNFYEHTLADNYALSETAYQIMLTTTVSLKPPYGDVGAPVLNSARGSTLDDLPNGCEIYIMDRATFLDMMDYLADKPWITQGFISIMAVPKLPDSMPGTDIAVNDAVSIKQLEAGRVPDVQVDLAPYFRDQIALGRYANLKKFLTYPYTAIELTTYSGNPLLLKPECVPNDMLTIVIQTHLAPPSPRIGIVARGYNAKADINVWDGEYLDSMTGIFDLPTFSVVNNGYMSFMAANRNSIAYQHASADWSQQRALRGADVSMGNTERGIALGRNLAGSAQQTIADNAALARTVAAQRALVGGANAVAGGVMKGAAAGPEGAAAGATLGILNQAADLAIQQNQIEQSAAISSGQIGRNASMTASTNTQTMDTNFAYAQFSARGDYSNAIAGINAKVQDAKLIQPTTSGQLGGDAFNLAVYKWGVFAKVKIVQPAVMAAIGEFWLRYGYAINRFGRMPADFQVMAKFTYWKLRETYITSSACPETYRQTIRGIFEKGVTVWANAEDIGMIDIADNAPKAGITL